MSERDGRRRFMTRRGFLAAGSCFGLLPGVRLLANEAAHGGGARVADPSQPGSPAWMKDLIVYEIATKGFTSPQGPESGTFASLRGRLPYLEELGVTGIWLTGYSLCDARHFYNIWTQYAVIEPDKFDPKLGTAEEFKALTGEAHRRGMRVFLDVITHGLMNDSRVVREHPEWFRGSSWGMKDFDWNGGHTELDDWWVEMYTKFVTEFGVDGFRLDVDIYRPDLWERIRRNAAAAGHPVVIFEEMNAVIPGVTDFTQRENLISEPGSGVLNEVLVNDLPGFYDRKFGRRGDYEVEVRYGGGETVKGSTKGAGPIGVRLMGLAEGRVGRREGEDGKRPDGLPNVHLELTGVGEQPIADLTVRSDEGDVWELRADAERSRPLAMETSKARGDGNGGGIVDVYVATLDWGSSIELSCHDNGWMGYPANKNPYAARGSRAVFGYSFLFSPMIPIFFAGEEFDATYHPLPELSPDLYGGRDPGKGRWLYGAMLDWSELNEAEHREMLLDVKRMMALRKRYREVLAMTPGGREPNLKAVRHRCAMEVPVPYLRWAGETAMVIAANRSRERDAAMELAIDLAGTGMDGHESYAVTDLWNGTAAKEYTRAELQALPCTVKRDGTGGGGLAVLKIERAATS